MPSNEEAEMGLDSDLTLFTKIDSKWVIDPNVKHKAVKLLEDDIKECLDDLVHDNGFTHPIPRVQSMKEIIHKLDFVKI
jgi:hypothetical protein